jgi:hypothetical protein
MQGNAKKLLLKYAKYLYAPPAATGRVGRYFYRGHYGHDYGTLPFYQLGCRAKHTLRRNLVSDFLEKNEHLTYGNVDANEIRRRFIADNPKISTKFGFDTLTMRRHFRGYVEEVLAD